jgi:hypothetical protein
MGHALRLNLTRSRTNCWRTIAVAALSACALTGCGSDDPTEPKPITLSDLFGSQLFKADGTQVSVGALGGTPLIGIYFASPDCPACAGFTPTLVDTYNQWEGESRSFEVVLVTSGVDESDLFEYMVDSNMPWLTLPARSSRVAPLVQRYDIRWVPTLVVIDAATNTITVTGREEVVQQGAGIYDAWMAAAGGGQFMEGS